MRPSDQRRPGTVTIGEFVHNDHLAVTDNIIQLIWNNAWARNAAITWCMSMILAGVVEAGVGIQQPASTTYFSRVHGPGHEESLFGLFIY